MKLCSTHFVSIFRAALAAVGATRVVVEAELGTKFAGTRSDNGNKNEVDGSSRKTHRSEKVW